MNIGEGLVFVGAHSFVQRNQLISEVLGEALCYIKRISGARKV